MIHAEVADRERGAGDIGRLQPAGPRAVDQLLSPDADLPHRQPVRVMNHAGDDGIVGGNRDRDVHAGIRADAAVDPARVHHGMFRQRARGQRDEQIAVRAAEPLARRDEPARVGLAGEKEMRNARPALRRPLRHHIVIMRLQIEDFRLQIAGL